MHLSFTGELEGNLFQYDDGADVSQLRDPRNAAAPLRTHASTHSDDITALHFLNTGSSPTVDSPNILLSASSDGLVSTSNADEDDEDESVLHVGNWGCSISQAGWIHGKAGPKIWASSDMETFSTWSDEVIMFQNLLGSAHQLTIT